MLELAPKSEGNFYDFYTEILIKRNINNVELMRWNFPLLDIAHLAIHKKKNNTLIIYAHISSLSAICAQTIVKD